MRNTLKKGPEVLKRLQAELASDACALATCSTMNLQIETLSRIDGARMDIIRDIEKVRRIVAITERFAASVRDFPCGHKPKGVGGKCDACEALKEWDALSSNSTATAGGPTGKPPVRVQPPCSVRRWCRWILESGEQCKGKPLPMTSVAGRKDLCPVHAYLEGDFDEANEKGQR